MKNVWSNCYSMLHLTFHKKTVFFFIFLIMAGLGYFLYFFPFPFSQSFTGTYICEEECFVESYVSLDLANLIQKQTKLKVNDQIYQVPIFFEEVVYLEDINRSVQKIKIAFSELPYSINQTISIQIILKEKALGNLVWDSLKGGDANA